MDKEEYLSGTPCCGWCSIPVKHGRECRLDDGTRLCMECFDRAQGMGDFIPTEGENDVQGI